MVGGGTLLYLVHTGTSWMDDRGYVWFQVICIPMTNWCMYILDLSLEEGIPLPMSIPFEVYIGSIELAMPCICEVFHERKRQSTDQNHAR